VSLDYDAIRRRLEAATPGHQALYAERPLEWQEIAEGWAATYCVPLSEVHEARAEFIAHAPADIADLLAECDRLYRPMQTLVTHMESVLKDHGWPKYREVHSSMAKAVEEAVVKTRAALRGAES
jgi:hypothetical protein